MDGSMQTVVDMTRVPEDLVFGLDIGTRSIVGTVGYKNNTDGFVVVAQVSIEHETRAMIDGQIHDIGQVARTIEKIRKRLEEMTGRKYTDVCIAAAGRVLKTVEAQAQMHFDAQTVVTNDQIYSLNMLGVENAYETLREELSSDEVKFYCVGYSVKTYYQNDYPITNLEGHKCTDIKTELIATFLPDEVVDGLYAAVERAGLYVANLTLEPIAAINVAIPERFRLLNIALVDVGAGTSDISITKDGAIIAYGMIPIAGDEVTETVARTYLTDFTEADRMKCLSTTQDEVEYHDIMGIPQKISSAELIAAVDETVRNITKNVSDKITELNGGKSVSAVFVVGGGGKIGGFTESLAEYQGLQKDRVALRGSEVLSQVKFMQEDITVDSLLVTPIGICLNYYEQRNNFIFVTVNGERIKLYDNNRLTIMDAALQVGFPNEELFPRRGDAVNFTVNGQARMHRGQIGEAAVIRLDGRETGINTRIESNDKIEITSSTKGKDAEISVGDIPEYQSTIRFTFNEKNLTCARFVLANGELVSEFYDIKDGDAIEILDYYTVKQVLEFMDILSYDTVTVNNMPADDDTKVYENFTIRCAVKEQVPEEYQTPPFLDSTHVEQEERAQSKEDSLGLPQEEEPEPEPKDRSDNGKTVTTAGSGEIEEELEKEPADEDTAQRASFSAEPEKKLRESKEKTGSFGGDKKPPAAVSGDIAVTVNGDTVVLKNKTSYILVDVLDFYPVDTSVSHGDHMEIAVNGVQCDFTAPIHAGDQIRLEWVG